MADFVTDFVADCVTDFGIFLSFKSVGKSFGGTYALICRKSADLFIYKTGGCLHQTIFSHQLPPVFKLVAFGGCRLPLVRFVVRCELG